MENKTFRRTFDATTWKAGNAIVITIPSSITKKFGIKKCEPIEVTIRR